MRVWDVPPKELCDRHLLGEHRELHAVWTILTKNRGGYRRHPETLRWEGRLAALYRRHERLVREMGARGFRHRSPLDRTRATGASRQTRKLESLAAQRRRLAAKPCACPRAAARRRTGPGPGRNSS